MPSDFLRRIARVSPGDVPTRVKVAAIIDATPARYRAAIALGVCGLRVGEVLGMHAEQLDLEARTVRIDRQLQRVGGALIVKRPKGEKVRTITVPSAVARSLREHPRDLRGDGLLFVSPRAGGPMRRDQFYECAWYPALKGAGLEARFVFHSLRHFCASSMLAEGVNPLAVAGHLGDTFMTLQRVYAHWLRDDRHIPADALESILVVSPARHALSQPGS